MQKSLTGKKLFATPFSRAYWAQAFSELKDVRMIAFAALILALRIVMKPLRIPIATDVNITFGFIVNALGSMVYGPVIAFLSGAVSDTLGYLVAPNGEYFILFIIPEMVGSLVFALFLYSTRVTAWRLILAKFCVNLFVNIVISEPIMVLYYQMFRTSVYQPFMWIRIVKNIVMLPLESVVLIVVFRGVMPAISKFCSISGSNLELNRKHIALIAALVVIGIGSAAGYVVYDYNTKSFSASYSPAERLSRNMGMKVRVLEENPELRADGTVVVIESARSQAGKREMTYEVAVYRIDPEKYREKHEKAEKALAEGLPEAKPYTMDTLNGYSKSPAKKDDALIPAGKGTVVLDKYTEERISVNLEWNGEETP